MKNTFVEKNIMQHKYCASIIIPVSNNCTILEYFIEHLKYTVKIEHYEIIFVIDGSVDNKILALLKKFSSEFASVIYKQLAQKTSYAHVNNFGRRYATSDLLFFMNTDIFVQENCLEIMINSLHKNNVQAVQPLLLYPQNNRVQSTGHIFGDCFNRHALKEQESSHPVVCLSTTRQALSLALCLIPTYIFDECNGFDEYYYNGWEGLDLTLKITKHGYKCWYESNARAYHVEGGSRKKLGLNESLQAGHFWSIWGKIVKDDIIDLLKIQQSKYDLSDRYVVYNFTTYRSWQKILDSLNISYEEIIDKTIYSNEVYLDFFNVLSYQALVNPEPILFLVTSLSSLKDNVIWTKYRKCKGDIFIDLSGNIGMLKTIVCGN